jgi:SAM-dependent methyltransferase
MSTVRVLTDSYSELEKLGAEYYTDHQHTNSTVPRLVGCFRKLVELNSPQRVLVVGCGPKPKTMQDFEQFGFDVVGVEPIAAYVDSANSALNRDAVRLGDAEHLPFENESTCFVVIESVLEHVDSPIQALHESFRVLKQGGVAYISTLNRFHLSLSGYNGEYRVPFFNWFPKAIKESYVYWHMHHDPRLANFTPRPAVHWFCYTDLCELGRQAGFFLFYSPLDLIDSSDPAITKGRARRLMLRPIRSNPWLRALALLQFGGAIFMYKRS